MKGLFVIAFEGFAILVESPFFGSRIRWLVLVTFVPFAFVFISTLVLPVATSVTTPVIALWPVPEAPSWPLVAVTVLASVPKTPAWAFVIFAVLASISVLEVPAWTFVAVTVLASVPETPAWPLVPLVVLMLWLAVTVHFLCLWYVAVK